MYFPTPTAAVATANVLFGTVLTSDLQHMGACETTPVTQLAPIIQVFGNANHVTDEASLVFAKPGGLVTLHLAAVTTGHMQNANHLINSSASMVELAGSRTSVDSATQALAPLFTMAHFYHK